MKYCCHCGSMVMRSVSVADGRERYSCPSCGSTHYQNPRVIVRCIVQHADSILMCQRAHEPARGQWEVPSGYLERGETLEEGAARETYEETGVSLDPKRLALYSVLSLATIDQVAWLSSATASAGRIFRGTSGIPSGTQELISSVCHGRAGPMRHLARS